MHTALTPLSMQECIAAEDSTSFKNVQMLTHHTCKPVAYYPNSPHQSNIIILIVVTAGLERAHRGSTIKQLLIVMAKLKVVTIHQHKPTNATTASPLAMM